jgi:hypothetical protein
MPKIGAKMMLKIDVIKWSKFKLFATQFIRQIYYEAIDQENLSRPNFTDEPFFKNSILW